MISNEAKLSAVIDALKSKGDFAKFTERSKPLTGVEAKLNCALAVLRETANIAEVINGEGAWDLVVVEKAAPRLQETFRESGRVVKNNGDGSFARSFSYETVNETDSLRTKNDVMLCESLGFTKEQTKNVLNLPDDGMLEGLTEGQRQEYKFARSIGISEADCLRLVNITGGYSNDNKRVSGRILESR